MAAGSSLIKILVIFQILLIHKRSGKKDYYYKKLLKNIKFQLKSYNLLKNFNLIFLKVDFLNLLLNLINVF